MVRLPNFRALVGGFNFISAGALIAEGQISTDDQDRLTALSGGVAAGLPFGFSVGHGRGGAFCF